MGVPIKVEGESIQQGTDGFAADCCQQAAGGAEQGELQEAGVEQYSSSGTQGAQHGSLPDPLIEGRLQSGEQHADASRQDEQKNVLDRQCDLGEDAAQLLQQRVDLKQSDGREGSGQLDQFVIFPRWQIEAGQVGDG